MLICVFCFFFVGKTYATWDWKSSFRKSSVINDTVKNRKKSLQSLFSFTKGKSSVYNNQNNSIKIFEGIFDFNKTNQKRQEVQLKKLKISFPEVPANKTIDQGEIPYMFSFFNQEYKEITRDEIICADCEKTFNKLEGKDYIICLVGKENLINNKLNQIISVSVSLKKGENYNIAPIDRTKITSDSWNNATEAINSNSQSLLEISTNTYSYRILPNRIVESQNNNDYIFYPFNSVTFDLIPNGVPSFKDNGNQVNYYTISNVVFSEE